MSDFGGWFGGGGGREVGGSRGFLEKGDFFGAVAHAGVPEGREEVGDVVYGGGGVDLPVGGEGRLGVGDVEEVVWLM